MKKEDKDNLASSKKPNKPHLPSSGPFPQDHGIIEGKMKSILPDPPKDADKEELARFDYLKKLRKRRILSKESRDHFVRIRFGWSKKEYVKNHPKGWAIYEFVENLKALEKEKDPWIRNSCRKEKEKNKQDLLKYLEKALENKDWKGIKGLGRIFEMAVTGERYMPLEGSHRVKLELAINQYNEEILARIENLVKGLPPNHWYVLSFQDPSESTDSPPAFEILVELISAGEDITFMRVHGIPDPTRYDLKEILGDIDPGSMDQIVREAKNLGWEYTIERVTPGPPPL